MQLLRFQFVIHEFNFLCQCNSIQVEVAVENGWAAGESAGKSAGEAAQEHILTCNTKAEHVLDVDAVKVWSGALGDPWMWTCCTGGLTCQVEVLQWSLGSYCSTEFRAESGQAMIRSVNLTFGGSNIVSVCDGGSSIDVLNLDTHKTQESEHTDLNPLLSRNLWQQVKPVIKSKTDKRKPNLTAPKCTVCVARQTQKGYLVSGYLGENIQNHLQNRVNEYLLQLLVVRPPVRHFAILPLLKPLIVGKTDQTQGGLAWCEEQNVLILLLALERSFPSHFCTWWSFLPGRIFSWGRGHKKQRHIPGRVFPLSVQVVLNPGKKKRLNKNLATSSHPNSAYKQQENAQFIKIVLCEDPVVVGFQAQLLLCSSQTKENTQTTFTVLHHAQLLLDGCERGVIGYHTGTGRADTVNDQKSLIWFVSIQSSHASIKVLCQVFQYLLRGKIHISILSVGKQTIYQEIKKKISFG